ncbi:MAG: hypothetical protein KatS3mg087_1593 [Patescibacteria group bacterium]|nr:MAG: hypothetical protein KatS3mg087_1593 [Patescibacteria group bacterium]
MARKLMKVSFSVDVDGDEVRTTAETSCDNTDRCDKLADALRAAPKAGKVLSSQARKKQDGRPVAPQVQPKVNPSAKGKQVGAEGASPPARVKARGSGTQ